MGVLLLVNVWFYVNMCEGKPPFPLELLNQKVCFTQMVSDTWRSKLSANIPKKMYKAAVNSSRNSPNTFTRCKMTR